MREEKEVEDKNSVLIWGQYRAMATLTKKKPRMKNHAGFVSLCSKLHRVSVFLSKLLFKLTELGFKRLK